MLAYPISVIDLFLCNAISDQHSDCYVMIRRNTATSGPSRKSPKAAIEAFRVYANALRFDMLLFTIYLMLYEKGSRAPETQS